MSLAENFSRRCRCRRPGRREQRWPWNQAGGADRREGFIQVGVGDVTDEQVLPHRQPQRAGAVALSDSGEPRASGRKSNARPDSTTDIVETGLLLLMHADMAVLSCAGRGWVARARHDELGAEFVLHRREELFQPQGIEQVFEARPAVRSVRSPSTNKHGAGSRCRPSWRRAVGDHERRVRRAKVGRGRNNPFEGDNSMAVVARQLHGAEGNVVGVFETARGRRRRTRC